MESRLKQGKEFLATELKNWKPAEIIWLAITVLTVLSLSLYWKDSVIGILAAVTGVLCVMLTGKGKLSS